MLGIFWPKSDLQVLFLEIVNKFQFPRVSGLGLPLKFSTWTTFFIDHGSQVLASRGVAEIQMYIIENAKKWSVSKKITRKFSHLIYFSSITKKKTIFLCTFSWFFFHRFLKCSESLWLRMCIYLCVCLFFFHFPPHSQVNLKPFIKMKCVPFRTMYSNPSSNAMEFFLVWIR